MKNAEAAISSWRGWSKKLEDWEWGLKHLGLGGLPICVWGGGGVSTPLHSMSNLFKKTCVDITENVSKTSFACYMLISESFLNSLFSLFTTVSCC